MTCKQTNWCFTPPKKNTLPRTRWAITCSCKTWRTPQWHVENVFSGPGRQHHRCNGAIRSVTQRSTVHFFARIFYHLIWLSSRICFKPLWCLSQWCTTRTFIHFIQKYYVAGVHDTCPACLPRCSCVQQHLVATVSFTGTLGRLCYHLTQLGSCECPSSHLIDFWKSVVKLVGYTTIYTGFAESSTKVSMLKSEIRQLMADILLYTL